MNRTIRLKLTQYGRGDTKFIIALLFVLLSTHYSGWTEVALLFLAGFYAAYAIGLWTWAQ